MVMVQYSEGWAGTKLELKVPILNFVHVFEHFIGMHLELFWLTQFLE